MRIYTLLGSLLVVTFLADVSRAQRRRFAGSSLTHRLMRGATFGAAHPVESAGDSETGPPSNASPVLGMGLSGCCIAARNGRQTRLGFPYSPAR